MVYHCTFRSSSIFVVIQATRHVDFIGFNLECRIRKRDLIRCYILCGRYKREKALKRGSIYVYKNQSRDQKMRVKIIKSSFLAIIYKGKMCQTKCAYGALQSYIIKLKKDSFYNLINESKCTCIVFKITRKCLLYTLDILFDK